MQLIDSYFRLFLVTGVPFQIFSVSILLDFAVYDRDPFRLVELIKSLFPPKCVTDWRKILVSLSFLFRSHGIKNPLKNHTSIVQQCIFSLILIKTKKYLITTQKIRKLFNTDPEFRKIEAYKMYSGEHFA